MISDASLDKLRNGMAKLTQARGTAKENAKLNNWYSAFKTEKAANREEHIEDKEFAALTAQPRAVSQTDLGEALSEMPAGSRSRASAKPRKRERKASRLAPSVAEASLDSWFHRFEAQRESE